MDNTEIVGQLASITAILEQHKESMKIFNEEMKRMNDTLIRNDENLRLHMKRSDELQAQNEILRKDFDTRIQPIQKHVDNVTFGTKAVMWLVACPAAIYYIAQLVRMLTGKI